MLVALTALHTGTGLTTTAAALAAAWPDRSGVAVVVEADPAEGRLGSVAPGDPGTGLISLARSVRSPHSHVRLTEHTRVLPSGVPVIAAPSAPTQVRAALTTTVTGCGSVARRLNRDVVVIADCGVAEPDSPALPLIRGADLLLVVIRADRVVGSARDRLARIADWSPRKALLLIGEDPCGEVAGTLGVPVAAVWPIDPAAAEVVVTGDRVAARTGSLHAAAADLAEFVAAQVPTQPHPAAYTRQFLARWWSQVIGQRSAVTVYRLDTREHATLANSAQPPVTAAREEADGDELAMVGVDDATPTALGTTPSRPGPDPQPPAEPVLVVAPDVQPETPESNLAVEPTTPSAARAAPPSQSAHDTGSALAEAGATDSPVRSRTAVRVAAGSVVVPASSAATASVLSVRVFGRLRVVWSAGPDADPVEITRFLRPRECELLTALVVHPQGATRATLIEAMWGEQTPRRPANALSTVLSRLRAAIVIATGGAVTGILDDGKARYRLAHDLWRVDYYDFDAAVTALHTALSDRDREHACRAILTAAGGILGEDLTADWIIPIREAARRDRLKALGKLAAMLVGAVVNSSGVARRWCR